MAISGLKTGLAVVVLLIAAAVLAPPPEPAKRIPNRQPVYFWHMWAGEWQPVVEKICRRFNDSQTEYEVVPLYVPPDGAASKFLLTAAGNQTPDLVSQWNPVLGSWSERKLIQPLEGVMTPAELTKFRKEAFPIIQKHATYDHKLMCAVAGVDCYAAFYRLDHLKEVGRDENSLPKTMEELVELGRQLDKFDANHSLKRIGYLPQALTTYSPIFGGRFQTEGEHLLDTPSNEKAMQFIVDNIKRLGKDNVTRFISSQPADTGINAPLITGNYSILIDGQWKVKQTDQFAPNLKYVTAPVPPPAGGPPMASATNANYMMIPTASKNPKGAWAFVKFWIGFDNPEAGALNVTDMGWLPFSEKVANSETYKAYLAKYPQFKTFVELMHSPNLETGPIGPMQAFVSDAIQKADDSAARLTLSPHDALARMEADVKQEEERQRRLGNVN